MESLNASDVKLFAVKVTQKWMGVNGMLTQVKFCYKMAARGRLQLPVDFLAPWIKHSGPTPAADITLNKKKKKKNLSSYEVFCVCVDKSLS